MALGKTNGRLLRRQVARKNAKQGHLGRYGARSRQMEDYLPLIVLTFFIGAWFGVHFRSTSPTSAFGLERFFSGDLGNLCSNFW